MTEKNHVHWTQIRETEFEIKVSAYQVWLLCFLLGAAFATGAAGLFVPGLKWAPLILVAAAVLVGLYGDAWVAAVLKRLRKDLLS